MKRFLSAPLGFVLTKGVRATVLSLAVAVRKKRIKSFLNYTKKHPLNHLYVIVVAAP
jgi:hypothetical protein